jgi:hypothetical protein
MKPADYEALTSFLLARGVSFDDLERVRIALSSGSVVISSDAVAQWLSARGPNTVIVPQADAELVSLLLSQALQK